MKSRSALRGPKPAERKPCRLAPRVPNFKLGRDQIPLSLWESRSKQKIKNLVIQLLNFHNQGQHQLLLDLLHQASLLHRHGQWRGRKLYHSTLKILALNMVIRKSRPFLEHPLGDQTTSGILSTNHRRRFRHQCQLHPSESQSRQEKEEKDQAGSQEYRAQWHK